MQIDRKETKDRARRLRRNSTAPEQILWSVLQNRGVARLKFRRQHPIGPFIVDFYCHEARLVVEIDGESHEGRQEADVKRQRFLESQGLRVLRVTNDDVLHDIEAVAMGVAKAAGIVI